MSEPRYPNESKAYRRARDRLLKDEQALIDKTKAVAKKRRQLPLGGRLKEDSVFQWAVDGKIGKPVKCSRLFGDKKTLLIYSFMFGPNWDNPCLSCTALVDGDRRNAFAGDGLSDDRGCERAPSGVDGFASGETARQRISGKRGHGRGHPQGRSERGGSRGSRRKLKETDRYFPALICAIACSINSSMVRRIW